MKKSKNWGLSPSPSSRTLLRPRAIAAFLTFATCSTALLTPLISMSSSKPLGTYVLETPDGDRQSYRIRESLPSHQTREWEYSLVEKRLLAPDTENPVLLARDLTGDGLPDTYFYRDEAGQLQVEELTSVRKDGWDQARPLLRDRIQHENRWLIDITLQSILSTLSLTAEHYQAVQESFYRDEIDLLSLEILTDLIAEKDPRDPFVGLNRSVVAEGYQALAHRAQNEEVDRLWMLLKVDAGVTAATGGIYSLLSKTVGIMGKAILSRYGNSIALKATEATLSPAAKTLAAAEAQALARIAASEAVRVSLVGSIARSRATQLMGKTLGQIGTLAKAGASQWKYIVTTQALQIGAEALARGEAVLDPNPLVVAKNLFTNKEFMQNFLFMSNETFWLTALSTHIQSPAKKILACAAFSLVDSNVMNYAVKGIVDPKRMALDSGWQMVIGNAQTQLDLAALKASQGAALAQSNPKLKALGYLVVIIDQGAGFYGYSKAATALESDSVETRIIPIVTETP